MRSICTSQLSHGFYSAWDMYRPRTVCTSSGSALGSTYSPHAVHIPYTVKTMRQLLHVHVYTFFMEHCIRVQHAIVLYTCNVCVNAGMYVYRLYPG